MKNITIPIENPKKNLLLVLIGVAILVGFNSFYNSLSVGLGAEFPNTTFLFHSKDLFADFIKTILSYPHTLITNADTWPKILKNYYFNNPYKGIEAIDKITYTHFHLLPLTTVLNLFSLSIVQLIGPIKTIVLSLIIYLSMIISLVVYVGRSKSDKFYLFFSNFYKS